VSSVLEALRGAAFLWRDAKGPYQRGMGVLVQEVDAVLPGPMHEGTSAEKAVHSAGLLAVMPEACKELGGRVEHLMTRFEELETKSGRM
jgi:hypothetical protein